ncbi:hypothetical protein AOA59_26880, partial [Pseudomonas sp. 2822-15]|uniref:hypothetical protein n=1 Tax=Pseudomonas sp. 2822-15 TaxID=1712677 RepID=UPI000C59E53C
VILFRDSSVTYSEMSEEAFAKEKQIIEVVHDIEALTKEALLSVLNKLKRKNVEHIIIILEKFTQIQLLFSDDSSMLDDDLAIQNHIDVIDAQQFWFQYSSRAYV